MTELHALAAEYGFAACHVLPPDPFVQYRRRQTDGALHNEGKRLCAEPLSAFPWANAILLCIMPYRPYALSSGLSGYYPASNQSYHAVIPFMEALAGRGIRAERFYPPVRELLIRSGLGMPLKNGLTALPPFGTRFVVQTLIANVPDAAFSAPPKPPVPACASCRACTLACPVGAIDESGFHVSRCARAYMCGETMPRWVMDAITTMLGCELCQFACPYNACIPAEEKAPVAFDLKRLLSGDISEARTLIGKNMNKNRKLQQHAAVLAGKQGRADLLPALCKLSAEGNDALRAACQYAISLLSKT